MKDMPDVNINATFYEECEDLHGLGDSTVDEHQGMEWSVSKLT